MNWVKELLEYIYNGIRFWVVVQPWEQGIRVRLGRTQKVLKAGVHLAVPLIDAVYIQDVRLRVNEMSVQTISTKDGEPLTLKLAMGYIIKDISKLYNTLHNPECTLENICKSLIAQNVLGQTKDLIKPDKIEFDVLQEMESHDYGIEVKYVKVSSFCFVNSFRLIQDQDYTYSAINLSKQHHES